MCFILNAQVVHGRVTQVKFTQDTDTQRQRVGSTRTRFTTPEGEALTRGGVIFQEFAADHRFWDVHPGMRWVAVRPTSALRQEFGLVLRIQLHDPETVEPTRRIWGRRMFEEQAVTGFGTYFITEKNSVPLGPNGQPQGFYLWELEPAINRPWCRAKRYQLAAQENLDPMGVNPETTAEVAKQHRQRMRQACSCLLCMYAGWSEQEVLDSEERGLITTWMLTFADSNTPVRVRKAMPALEPVRERSPAPIRPRTPQDPAKAPPPNEPPVHNTMASSGTGYSDPDERVKNGTFGVESLPREADATGANYEFGIPMDEVGEQFSPNESATEYRERVSHAPQTVVDTAQEEEPAVAPPMGSEPNIPPERVPVNTGYRSREENDYLYEEGRAFIRSFNGLSQGRWNQTMAEAVRQAFGRLKRANPDVFETVQRRPNFGQQNPITTVPRGYMREFFMGTRAAWLPGNGAVDQRLKPYLQRIQQVGPDQLGPTFRRNYVWNEAKKLWIPDNTWAPPRDPNGLLFWARPDLKDNQGRIIKDHPEQSPGRLQDIDVLWDYAQELDNQGFGFWHEDNAEGRFCAPYNGRRAVHHKCGFEFNNPTQRCRKIHLCTFCECPDVNATDWITNATSKCRNYYGTCCTNRLGCPGAYAAHMGKNYRYRAQELLNRREMEFQDADEYDDERAVV